MLFLGQIGNFNRRTKSNLPFIYHLQDFGYKLGQADKSEDLIKLGGGLEDIEVWCSEKVNFLAEWRIWILDGKIIGINPYRGRWDLYPDPKVLQQAVNAYHSAPRAYALDFGITDKRETLLVEVSDAYALSSFGLDSVLYTKILITRWQELTSTIKISVE